MKKLILSLCVIVVIVFVTNSAFVKADEGQWEHRHWYVIENTPLIHIGDKIFDVGTNIWIKNFRPNAGRTMVPLRVIGENVFGAYIQWERPGCRQIYVVYALPLELGGEQIVEIQMDVDDRYASVTSWIQNAGESNTDKVTRTEDIDVPPLNIDGTVFVPLRFIVETYFSEVDWDASTPMGSRKISVRSRVGFIPYVPFVGVENEE